MNKKYTYILISAIVVGIIAYLLALWWYGRKVQALPVATATPPPTPLPPSPVVVLPPAPVTPSSSIPEPTPPPPAPPPIVVVTTVPAPEPTPPPPPPPPVVIVAPPPAPTYAVPTVVKIGGNYYLKGIPAPYDNYPIIVPVDHTYNNVTGVYPTEERYLGTNPDDYYYLYIPTKSTGAPLWAGVLIAERKNPAIVLGGLSGEALQKRVHGFDGFAVSPPRRFLINPSKNLIGGSF